MDKRAWRLKRKVLTKLLSKCVLFWFLCKMYNISQNWRDDDTFRVCNVMGMVA